MSGVSQKHTGSRQTSFRTSANWPMISEEYWRVRDPSCAMCSLFWMKHASHAYHRFNCRMGHSFLSLLEDLWPFLDREEFESNMSISVER